jgi:hypothetical protein
MHNMSFVTRSCGLKVSCSRMHEAVHCCSGSRWQTQTWPSSYHTTHTHILSVLHAVQHGPYLRPSHACCRSAAVLSSRLLTRPAGANPTTQQLGAHQEPMTLAGLCQMKRSPGEHALGPQVLLQTATRHLLQSCCCLLAAAAGWYTQRLAAQLDCTCL